MTPIPAHTLPADALHHAFSEAFADYLIGPFQLSPAQWPGFLARQGVDLSLSRAILAPAGPCLAFALVAPRPDERRWRLATLGARPSARGSGVAAQLLDDMLVRARSAGQEAVELEVFAQNPRALRLYQGRGFEVRHALHGFSLQAPPPQGETAAPPPIQAVPRGDALAWLAQARRRWPDLPLQVSDLALQHQADWLAWQAPSGTEATAQLVASLPDAHSVLVHSLVSAQAEAAAALLDGVLQAHPGRRLRVPPLQRDDLGGQVLRARGATVEPLHQLWMWRPL